jgi:ArsR family transcriptional regulator, arsenate/arsenite/antimonite-responsive transcriptional repressor / arsenate reductase (thioredoxin)
VTHACGESPLPLYPQQRPVAEERIHWSIADPAALEGDEAVKLHAFRAAADELTTRLRYFLALLERRQD